jgi:hypothetical protein
VWGGNTTIVHTANGSGNGIADLNAGNAEVADASKKLSVAENPGNKYIYNIAFDAFVVGVKNDGNMAFLANGLTIGQLTQIWNAQANISTLHWDELVPAPTGATHNLIVPRARITGSGSRPDWDKAISVPDANENVTITTTGLPRLAESSDMADQAENNDDQIVYTSLGQIDTHPGMLVVPISNGGPFVSPNSTTVFDGSYPLPRTLWIMDFNIATRPRINGVNDDSNEVRADDWINYMRSSAVTGLIGAEGFLPAAPSPLPPFPDWDINDDGTTSLGDILGIAGRWGQTSACAGAVRADGNNDGKVSLGDIGVVTKKWGQTGFTYSAPY